MLYFLFAKSIDKKEKFSVEAVALMSIKEMIFKNTSLSFKLQKGEVN